MFHVSSVYCSTKLINNLESLAVTNDSQYGVHGYDNEDELMHALFMAKGVDFKTASKIEVFESVELLELFAKILNINTTEIRLKYQSNDDVSITIKYFQRKFFFFFLEMISKHFCKLLFDLEIPNGTIVLLVILSLLIVAVMVFAVINYRKRRNYNL